MKRTKVYSYSILKWRKILLLTIPTLTILLLTTKFLHKKPQTKPQPYPLPDLPRLAYLISAPRGGSQQLRRLLEAVYHPRNYYLIDNGIDEERMCIAKYVKSNTAMRYYRNVFVVGKGGLGNVNGPTYLAGILHGVAVLLRRVNGFHWFVNLSVEDYPLLSQDGHEAVYHPRNYYLRDMDNDEERMYIAKYVKSNTVMRYCRNVFVVGNADLVNVNGPTYLAGILHALAVLLKRVNGFDWFVNLSFGDYPLLSQDDILHIFSYLPRDLNFIEHTSDIGWKEHQRARPIIIDPGLYHEKKSSVFVAKEKRSLPSAFKLFTGSERVVLSKSFIDFCIWGWDNLPRTVLMYYTNFLSSSEGYFHTVACNHQNYQNTTVNHDLRYMKWDNANQHPVNLTGDHFEDMVQSGAPFAHRFANNDPILQKIDHDLLRRMDGQLVPGGWCLGPSINGKDPCRVFGSIDAIKPSVNSRRLAKLILQLIDPENFRSKQCK